MTYFLILVNAIFFIVELLTNFTIVGSLAFYWPTVLVGHWELLLSSMFTHASFDHIIGNMAFLLAFGPKIERNLKHIPYLILYLLGGSFAAFGFVLWGGAYEGAIGASGAIAFILGIFWQVYPNSIITVPLTSTKVRTIYYLGFWFLLQALFTVIHSTGGVAYAAHATGFLFGALLAHHWKLTKYRTEAFGLLERPWKLNAEEALKALGALVG